MSFSKKSSLSKDKIFQLTTRNVKIFIQMIEIFNKSADEITIILKPKTTTRNGCFIASGIGGQRTVFIELIIGSCNFSEFIINDNAKDSDLKIGLNVSLLCDAIKDNDKDSFLTIYKCFDDEKIHIISERLGFKDTTRVPILNDADYETISEKAKLGVNISFSISFLEFKKFMKKLSIASSGSVEITTTFHQLKFSTSNETGVKKELEGFFNHEFNKKKIKGKVKPRQNGSCLTINSISREFSTNENFIITNTYLLGSLKLIEKCKDIFEKIEIFYGNKSSLIANLYAENDISASFIVGSIGDKDT